MAVEGMGVLKTRKMARGFELLILESLGPASVGWCWLILWSPAEEQREKTQEPGSELTVRLVDY